MITTLTNFHIDLVPFKDGNCDVHPQSELTSSKLLPGENLCGIFTEVVLGYQCYMCDYLFSCNIGIHDHSIHYITLHGI